MLRFLRVPSLIHAFGACMLPAVRRASLTPISHKSHRHHSVVWAIDESGHSLRPPLYWIGLTMTKTNFLRRPAQNYYLDDSSYRCTFWATPCTSSFASRFLRSLQWDSRSSRILHLDKLMALRRHFLKSKAQTHDHVCRNVKFLSFSLEEIEEVRVPGANLATHSKIV